jgi:hypothetical protein
MLGQQSCIGRIFELIFVAHIFTKGNLGFRDSVAEINFVRLFDKKLKSQLNEQCQQRSQQSCSMMCVCEYCHAQMSVVVRLYGGGSEGSLKNVQTC